VPAFIKRASALIFLICPLALAYEDGAPGGYTGGFGEDDCSACHADNERNAAGGALFVDGLPAVYVPGRVYPISIVLTHPELASAGVQLSMRYTDGSDAGLLEGTTGELEPLADGDTTYLQHSRAALPDDAHNVRWQLLWRAPLRPGRVLLHVAANAANDDRSALGDFVYTAEQQSEPGAVTD
jgi:hypothetical protein